jgi:hypothetical protein
MLHADMSATSTVAVPTRRKLLMIYRLMGKHSWSQGKQLRQPTRISAVTALKYQQLASVGFGCCLKAYADYCDG